VVSRRFSDFERLKAELTVDGNPGVKAAVFPRKYWCSFSRIFSLKFPAWSGGLLTIK